MKRILLFLSIVICSVLNSKADNDIVSDTISNHSDKYAFELETPKATLTGILLVKAAKDEVLGSFVNEFGISAIDFSYSKKTDKVKLANVAGFLNKWYIKLVLRKDIRFVLKVLKNLPVSDDNYVIIRSGDILEVMNKKRNIRYKFRPITIACDETE